jgi:hypothetical protein
MSNPVLDGVNYFYQLHPVLTIVLGILFFPEIELVIGCLALVAALLLK